MEMFIFGTRIKKCKVLGSSSVSVFLNGFTEDSVIPIQDTLFAVSEGSEKHKGK